MEEEKRRRGRPKKSEAPAADTTDAAVTDSAAEPKPERKKPGQKKYSPNNPKKKKPNPDLNYNEVAAEVATKLAAEYAVKAKKSQGVGRGGIYNPPQARIQMLEQDDEKRAFIGKTISNMIEFSYVGMSHPVQNDEELCERVNWVMQRCAETQQLVTWEKVCVALGYAMDTVKDWRLGRLGGFSPATKGILNQVTVILAAIDADLAQENKIPAVPYIFRAKNFYGMTDQQEVVVTPNNPLGDAQDAKTIEAKYDELPD